DDLVALQPGVQLRKLLQRLRTGPEHGGDEKLEVEPGEVALLHPRDGRHLAVSARHVLRNQAADSPQRLPPALAGTRGRADIVLRDTPVRSGAGDRLDVDAELLRN